MDFKYKSNYKAQRGENGKGGLKNGSDGKTMIIKVPCGTQIFNEETGELLADLVSHEQEIVIAKGGKGGKGNVWFATPSNRTPRFAEDGKHGIEIAVRLELKLLADVGLVGFPNVGKSTLISRISKAKPKIADYPFTTLIPNLGIVYYKDYYSFSVADNPGLIEGANEGRGLGIQFLQHIERTKVIVFMLDPFSENIKADFKILLNELRSFNEELIHKPRLIVITKIDALDSKTKNELKKIRIDRKYPLLISAHSGEGLEDLITKIVDLLQEST